MNILVVVDMQKDFISGVLGTPEAQAVLPKVAEKIAAFEGEVIYTRDTHTADYLNTQEGKILPVEHCIKDTDGWQIDATLTDIRGGKIIDKPTFGSIELAEHLAALHEREVIGRITLVGLCTDICVISNALLIKATLPEVPIAVDAACCAGVTPESHQNALNAMKMCQIIIENE